MEQGNRLAQGRAMHSHQSFRIHDDTAIVLKKGARFTQQLRVLGYKDSRLSFTRDLKP